MSKHGYGEMRVDPVSGAVLGGKLQQVYVYEAPVRIWHWLMMIAMFVLIPTGYLIGSPWSGPREEASFTYFFGNIRTIHFVAAMVFAVAFVVRLYWAIIGNHHARAIFIPPVWNFSWWKGSDRPGDVLPVPAQGVRLVDRPQPARAVRDVLHVRARVDRHHPHRLFAVRRAVRLGLDLDERVRLGQHPAR